MIVGENTQLFKEEKNYLLIYRKLENRNVDRVQL